MPNANKSKGDRAERAVRDFLVAQGFTGTFKTRAGFDDDLGDVIVPRDPNPATRSGFAVQVKDWATPAWKAWFSQLADQVRVGGHRHGVIWWKRRGSSDPGTWTVMMDGNAFVEILDHLGYPREVSDGTE